MLVAIRLPNVARVVVGLRRASDVRATVVRGIQFYVPRPPLPVRVASFLVSRRLVPVRAFRVLARALDVPFPRTRRGLGIATILLATPSIVVEFRRARVASASFPCPFLVRSPAAIAALRPTAWPSFPPRRHRSAPETHCAAPNAGLRPFVRSVVATTPHRHVNFHSSTGSWPIPSRAYEFAVRKRKEKERQTKDEMIHTYVCCRFRV